MVFLNQAHAAEAPALTWFLEIIFVHTPVCVCLCVHLEYIKTSGMIWGV